jgi:EmrB/QacA subfamily drug resistance transporter
MSTKFKPGWVLALTSCASLMVLLDAMVVTTALNTIRLDLGATIEQLEWTMNAYTLSFAVLLVTAAALGDRYGRRRLFILGLGVFTLASAACALAPGIGTLIAARTVQGAGSAMVMPHAMALLAAAYPPERRARALGFFSSVSGLATLGGPMVGGAIAQGASWQWIFWLNVPIGAVLIPLARTRVPESTAPAGRLDGGGLVLVTVGALGLVWGLIKADSLGWTSPEVLGSLAVGAAGLSAFVAWELRADRPMLPMRLFARRGFAAGNASGFLLYTAIFGAAFLMAQFFQVTEHTGPLGAGVRMLPWTVTLFLVAPVAGSLVNRVGERPLVIAGLGGQAIGFGALALLATADRPYPQLILPLIVAGCGVSLAMPAAQNATLGSVPRDAIGTASGTFNTLRQLGGVLGVAILAAVFAARGGYTSATAFASGFRPALLVAALLSLGGAAVGRWIPAREVPSEVAAATAPQRTAVNARAGAR